MVAVVVSYLYPIVPVLLGVTVLGERLIPRQAAGLLVAASAVTLLATS
ncbi:putative membrane protein [Rhodococcus sp. JVH1]|nr:putative membrane protein [Rhodococcus sp. JVH1]EJI98917.1 putative membrane protein [Rhodococcus sp. JVH1]